MELLLLRIILVLASLLTISATNSEGDALLDMKLKLKATGNQLSDWNWRQINPCTWYSVVCDNNNSVVEVTLPSMGFTGVLSPRIGELKHLNVLSLAGNRITGGIPEQFGKLSRLTCLDLEENLLSGPIPASLGRLSKLHVLILSENRLSGTIPDTLASIPSLRDIRLAYNNLSGQIPGRLFHVAHYKYCWITFLWQQPLELWTKIPPSLCLTCVLPRIDAWPSWDRPWTDPEPEAENDANGGSLKPKA